MSDDEPDCIDIASIYTRAHQMELGYVAAFPFVCIATLDDGFHASIGVESFAGLGSLIENLHPSRVEFYCGREENAKAFTEALIEFGTGSVH